MKNIIGNKEVSTNVRNRITALLSKRNGTFEGTMTELMTALTRGRDVDMFPGSTSSLRRVIDKLVPSLRREGYRVQFSRTTDSSRRRIVNFERIAR